MQDPSSTGEAPSVALGTWLSVAQAYNQCETLMAQRLAQIGLKTGEHEILANLLREPGIGQQTLAQRCFTAKSHVSALLSSLETMGWIRREPDPADARAKKLYLTVNGETVARQAAAIQADVVATMCDGESAVALREVRAAMQRVSGRLGVALGGR